MEQREGRSPGVYVALGAFAASVALCAGAVVFIAGRSSAPEQPQAQPVVTAAITTSTTVAPSAAVTEPPTTATAAAPAPAPVCRPASGRNYQVEGVPAGDVLNVRAAPSPSSAAIGTRQNGDVLAGTGRTGGRGAADWVQVVLDGGRCGYVRATFVTFAGTTSCGRTIQSSYMVENVPSGDRLNIRAAPSASSAILYRVDNGDDLNSPDQVGSGSGDWVRVYLPDGSGCGWVSSRFLMFYD